ncbi:MAG TPA: hypothetical protein VL500_05480 [Candidatus Eisenbacteria bacterium]|nr:hypothetical protein [Candidatus Eisenbacteria bacterium]
MRSSMEKKLGGIAESLAASKTDIPLPLKLRAAEMILHVMNRRKRHFGLFVILGWQRKWQDHLDISDSQQDIFAAHHTDIMRLKLGARRRVDVADTIDFDGAILIDRHGTIVHSGVFIEGLRPRVVAQKLNPGRYTDLSEQFGFETKVHARHLSAITASYVFKGTTVYTVSEENDAFHVFEGGRIMHHL